MQTLIPLTLRDAYYLPIEREIRRIFDQLIYVPMLAILGLRISGIEGYEIRNTGSALIDAIELGTVWYDNGKFQGRFNARISSALQRIGAVFSDASKSWLLSHIQVPSDVRMAQARANIRYEELRRRMLLTLNDVTPEKIDATSRTKRNYEKTVTLMETDLQKTVAIHKAPESALSQIIIEAKLTEKQKEIIAEEWGTNLDKYIKGWVAENVIKLRDEITPHVLSGGRALGLVKVIQDNYGVSLRKAKFLARQETSLLMSKFQESRYRDIGIQRYRWSDSHDKRVRHDHHLLNGKIFSWDMPPVTNRKTGTRNNPGEDFGCRCVAIPVVE